MPFPFNLTTYLLAWLYNPTLRYRRYFALTLSASRVGFVLLVPHDGSTVVVVVVVLALSTPTLLTERGKLGEKVKDGERERYR